MFLHKIGVLFLLPLFVVSCHAMFNGHGLDQAQVAVTKGYYNDLQLKNDGSSKNFDWFNADARCLDSQERIILLQKYATHILTIGDIDERKQVYECFTIQKDLVFGESVNITMPKTSNSSWEKPVFYVLMSALTIGVFTLMYKKW